MARTMRKQAVVALAVGACTLANAQDVPPPPPAMPVEGVDGMCVVAIYEYAGRWSQPDNGLHAPTQVMCAEMCAADETCSGATFIIYDPLGADQLNCWFKEWEEPGTATPCLPSENAMANKEYSALIKAPDCNAIVYKSEPLMCDDEMDLAPGEGIPPAGAIAAEIPGMAAPAMAPAMMMPPSPPLAAAAALMALDPPFVATPDVDFAPDDVTPMSAQLEDLARSNEMAVETCAELCIALPGCNAFAWYGEKEDWPAPDNCYLKTIEPGCTPPPEAHSEPGAYLVMAQTDACPEMAPMMAPTMAPMAAGMPAAAAGAPMMPVGAPAPIGFAPPVTPGAAPAPAMAAPVAPMPAGTGGPPPLAPIAGTADPAAPAVEQGTPGSAAGVFGSALLAVAVAAAVAVVV